MRNTEEINQDITKKIKENVVSEMSQLYILGYSQGNRDGYSKALNDIKVPDRSLKEPMSPQEFQIKMLDIMNMCGDTPEEAHSSMDELMCTLLISLGYQDGIDVFNSQERWYS